MRKAKYIFVAVADQAHGRSGKSFAPTIKQRYYFAYLRQKTLADCAMSVENEKNEKCEGDEGHEIGVLTFGEIL